MSPEPDLEKIANILFECACRSFRETEQYQMLLDEHDKKAAAYEEAQSKEMAKLINAYLQALNELHSAESEFLYRKGFKDCIYILKKMGAI